MLTDKQKAQAAARQKRFRRRQQDTRRCEQIEKGLPPMPAIPSMPGTPRWRAAIEAAQALVSEVLDEMEYYFEDRSDTWQESLQGDQHKDRQAEVKAVLKKIDQIYF